jgi:pimeloyl-ACP methyl ester carboxylesterase
LSGQPGFDTVPVGYFGASTGAAAALVAAARMGNAVSAVVSRGGRPDLAGEALGRVWAPTLLLVGSLDEEVLRLNQEAQAQLRTESELVVIEGAGHLFEEPGTLEAVAEAAGDWFVERMGKN